MIQVNHIYAFDNYLLLTFCLHVNDGGRDEYEIDAHMTQSPRSLRRREVKGASLSKPAGSEWMRNKSQLCTWSETVKKDLIGLSLQESSFMRR